MVWTISFAAIEAHLERFGYRRVKAVEGNVLFLRGRTAFTIREPNVLGYLPENIVNDAFDLAGLERPDQGTAFSD